MRFVGHLFQGGVSSGTVKSYLAAVRHTQIIMGLGDPHIPDMPRLDYVVKGFKRLAIRTPRQRLPITLELLSLIRDEWQGYPCKRDAAMLWAASCLAFFGFLRIGELVAPGVTEFDSSVHLCYGDVCVDRMQDPSYLEIHIKASRQICFVKGSISTWESQELIFVR